MALCALIFSGGLRNFHLRAITYVDCHSVVLLKPPSLLISQVLYSPDFRGCIIGSYGEKACQFHFGGTHFWRMPDDGATSV